MFYDGGDEREIVAAGMGWMDLRGRGVVNTTERETNPRG